MLQADPLCSFGDFVAISEVVDLSTALLLKIEASTGIGVGVGVVGWMACGMG